MIVIGTDLVGDYFAEHAGHKGIKVARSQYDAWLDIVTHAEWRNPKDVKASYPKVSILKVGRVVFNIGGNKYRLVVRINYAYRVVYVRFAGTHSEYDQIDAEQM
jgi:mRNA interferase HigB